MSFYNENDDIDDVDIDDDGYDSIADDLKQKAQDKALDKFEKSLNDRLNNNAGKNGSSSPTSTEGTTKATETSGKSLEKATDSISDKGINKATTDTSTKVASDSASKVAGDTAGKTAGKLAGDTAGRAVGAGVAETGAGVAAGTGTGVAAGTGAGVAAGTGAGAGVAAGTGAGVAAGTGAGVAAGTGAAAAGAGAGAAAGSAVPVIGTIIGVVAGYALGKIAEHQQKKKQKEKEEGKTKTKFKKLLKNPLFWIIAFIFILIVLVVGVEQEETIDTIMALVERREKRYAEGSGVTYEREVLDENNNPEKDENGNIKKEKIKPIILFSASEINELLYTSYYKLDEDNKLNYDFSSTGLAAKAMYEFNKSTYEEVQDMCYNQILYTSGTNEIAELLSSAGVDSQEVLKAGGAEDPTLDPILKNLDPNDQLQIASYFVRYCINAQKSNFNSIDWYSGSDSGSYTVTEEENFSSEEDYKNNSKEVSYSGDGSVNESEIPESQMDQNVLDTGLNIPSVQDYPIAEEDLGDYEIWDSWNNDARARTMLQYVNLTEDHLIEWIVPFALLTDTNGDFEWIQKITQDASSDIDITLYDLQQLTKTIEREYYLVTESYYTFELKYYDTSSENVIKDAYDLIVPSMTGYYDTKSNLYSGRQIIQTSNTRDEDVGEHGGFSAGDLGLSSSWYETINNTMYRVRVDNVKKHTDLKKDEIGNYIIAKNSDGTDMVRNINVKRELSSYQIVPKITYAADMYDIGTYKYRVNPIVEDDSLGDTDGNSNAPVELVDGKYGKRTTTKTYHETLDFENYQKEEYSLSYMSEEEKENLNRKISRIEWAQDFGRLTESPAGVEMSTSEITDALWKFFIDKGLPEITAAAIMGNIQQESGFILDSLSYDGNNSIGLCQWTFGRRTALQEFARNMGLHETDLEAQMEYLWKELNTPGVLNGYRGSIKSLEELKAIDDIEVATEQFCWSFERPLDAQMDKRVQYAKNWYTTYAGTYNSSIFGSGEIEKEENNYQLETVDNSNLIQIAANIHDKYKNCSYDLSYAKEIPFTDDQDAYDCSSFISYVLYEAGYEDDMKGPQHTAETLASFCQQQGWQRIDNINDLQPGDILFYGDDPNKISTIFHVDLLVENKGSGNCSVYSGGSVNSIRSNGPSNQNIQEERFVFAYRPNINSDPTTSSANVIFGEGNIYDMFPTKSRSEKQETYDKYYGTRTTSTGRTFTKGYAYEELVVAFEYIEEAYRSNSSGNGLAQGGNIDLSNVSVSSSGYISPIAGVTLDPNKLVYPSYPGHTGLDINQGNTGIVVNGVDVVAVKAGTVVTSTALRNPNGSYRSYGEYVVIDHHDGTFTLYAHMQSGSRTVAEGTEVTQGQIIGKVGSTGNSTGPHLHFEVRVGTNSSRNTVNPIPYLT